MEHILNEQILNEQILNDMIKFISDAYKIPQRINIVSDDKQQIIMKVELKLLSPYVDNIVKFIIQPNVSDYVICLNKVSSHDSITGANILYKTIQRFVRLSSEKTQSAFSDMAGKKTQRLLIDNLNKTDKIIIKKQEFSIFMESMIMDVNENCSLYYKICPICFIIKEIDTMIISPCEECIPLSFNKIYTNIVTDLYTKDINQFKLLLYTTLKAIDNKERFMPLPKYCLTGDYDDPQISSVSRDMGYYIKHIEASSNDNILFSRIKETEYMLLKHIIVSNNIRLNYFDNSSQGFVDKTNDLWSDSSKGSSIIFTVDHPLDKQLKFDSATNVVHAFHGSSIFNWYSIMRNGLKNYSGTALMSAGQACGPGIYLAKDMNASLGYCRVVGSSDFFVMGCVQVLNSEKYEKNGGNFLVVPDESDVLLKYLILFRPNNFKTSSPEIQKYLTVEIPAMIKSSIQCSIGITIKRLNKEYAELSKRIDKLIKSTVIEIDRTNIDDISSGVKWKILIRSKKEIIINIIFPRTFPSSPPIINSNNIEVKSVPMMEGLTDTENNTTYTYTDPMTRYDKWRSDVKIFKILEQMIKNVVEYAS
jgi:hypothetical protein